MVVSRFQPLYKCRGVTTGVFPRFAVEIDGRVIIRRAGQMACLDFLLGDVYPDPSHWKQLYPYGRNKIDAKAAASWFIRECRKAGTYSAKTGKTTPPE